MFIGFFVELAQGRIRPCMGHITELLGGESFETLSGLLSRVSEALGDEEIDESDFYQLWVVDIETRAILPYEFREVPRRYTWQAL